jgi:glycosyltransferase involved in cell wall biosynthesis
MKVIQINNIKSRRGGADIVFLNTTELLREKGNEVFIFTETLGENETSNEVKKFDYLSGSFLKKIINFPRFIYSQNNKRKLFAYLNKVKPEIAHVHLFKGTLTPSIFHALKKFNIPVVLTLHDYGLLCPRNLFISSKSFSCTKCLSESSFQCIINKCNRDSYSLSIASAIEFSFFRYYFPFNKYFDAIITVSKFSYDIHSKNLSFKNKLIQLYNFNPNNNADNADLNLKGKYFLYYGRLSREKGVSTLINAWIESRVTLPLYIIGTGPEYQNIKSISLEHPNLHVLGYKFGSELNSYIKNSYFVICPSEWFENNPMTIVESFSFGIPVIGTRIGGIPELIINNTTGYLFDVKDVSQLSNILRKCIFLNNIEYINLKESALNFAKNNFSRDVHYNNLMNIYQEAIFDYNKIKS